MAPSTSTQNLTCANVESGSHPVVRGALGVGLTPAAPKASLHKKITRKPLDGRYQIPRITKTIQTSHAMDLMIFNHLLEHVPLWIRNLQLSITGRPHSRSRCNLPSVWQRNHLTADAEGVREALRWVASLRLGVWRTIRTACFRSSEMMQLSSMIHPSFTNFEGIHSLPSFDNIRPLLHVDQSQ